MYLDNSGRRRYKRVFYSAEDKIVGFFSIPGDNNRSITANVMNMSIGGLHFTLKRDDNIRISQGDKIILHKVTGNIPFQFVANIEAEIKWVLDHHLMKHIGFGCEFVNLSDITKKQLQSLVESGCKSTFVE